MRDYIHFARSSWPLLLFGLVSVFTGNIGQSFFISWYGAEIQSSLELTAASYGTAYSLATLASGTAIMVVGGWIDRISLFKYACFVSVGLFLACWLFYFSDHIAVLFAAFFMIRLCGQGLMPHTGFTTMARSFNDSRGKALSIAASGIPLGEIILPAVAVVLIAIVGWQSSWVVLSFFIPLVYVPAIYFLLKKSEALGYQTSAPLANKNSAETKVSGRKLLLSDKRFWCALPVITSAPFVITGLFIHQGFILQEKSWTPEFFAMAFVVYGVVHWLASLAAGVMVDKYSAARLLPFYVMPMVFSLFVVAFFSAPWVAIVMLALLGLTIGAAGPVIGSLWAEIYGTDQLGAIRSTSTTFIVWSTSISPILFGFLIDKGVSLSTLLLTTAFAVVCASLLSMFSYREEHLLQEQEA